MKRIPARYRKYVEENAPAFAEAVRAIRDKNGRLAHPHSAIMETNLEAFNEDVVLLYACLWYAASEHVPMIFRP